MGIALGHWKSAGWVNQTPASTAYLRLDEFVAEYDMPSYQYAGQQLQSKAFQNMLIQDSGLTKFLKP